MLINILFIAKDQENTIKIKDVKQVFQKIFDFCDDKIKYNEVQSISSTFAQTSENRVVSAELDIQGETLNQAQILSECKSKIRNGTHRKDFHIIIAHDESSEYYGKKLFSWLSKYERKLRHFIYITIIKAFGNRWVKETIEENLLSNIKSRHKSRHKNPNKLIEDALEEFTYNDYIVYLFQKYPDLAPLIVVEKAIEYCNQDEFEEDKLIALLEKGIERSLWERFFHGTEIEDLKNNIDEIRIVRNSVMHNKEIEHGFFLKSKKLLRKSIKEIDKAIVAIKEENYFDVSVSDVFISFDNVIKSLSSISEPILKMQEMLHNLTKPISEMMKSVNTQELERLKSINLSLKRSIDPSHLNSIADMTKLASVFNRTQLPQSIIDRLTQPIREQQAMIEILTQPIRNRKAMYQSMIQSIIDQQAIATQSLAERLKVIEQKVENDESIDETETGDEDKKKTIK